MSTPLPTPTSSPLQEHHPALHPASKTTSRRSLFRQRSSPRSPATTEDRPSLQRSSSGFSFKFRSPSPKKQPNTTHDDAAPVRTSSLRRLLFRQASVTVPPNENKGRTLDCSATSQGSTFSFLAASPSPKSNSNSPQSSSRRLKRTKSLSQSCKHVASSLRHKTVKSSTDEEELEALTRDLERMALALGKVEHPDRIVLKHFQQTRAPLSSAA